MKLLRALLLACAAIGSAHAQQDWGLLHNGAIVLFRHAIAPGIGDPPGMKLGDCSTQRNLSEEGRSQALRIGQQFRSRNIFVGQVLASQWCRTGETARLAFGSEVREQEVFNSFFGEPDQSPAQTRAAMAVLNAWKGPGVLVVVTHQVNITALSGVVPASGEGIIVKLGSGRLQVLGRIQP